MRSPGRGGYGVAIVADPWSAVLSGTACCGPVVLIVLGMRASSAVLTAFQFALPLGALELLGSLPLVGDRIESRRR